MNEIEFIWKESAPIKIEFDPNALTWADLLSFQDLTAKRTNGELTELQLLEELNKILSKLVNQDVTKLPARIVNKLIEEFTKVAGNTENLKN